MHSTVCWFLFHLSVYLSFMSVFYLHLFTHPFLHPPFLSSTSLCLLPLVSLLSARYIGVLSTWDKLSILTPWIYLMVTILLLSSFVLLSPTSLCFVFFSCLSFPSHASFYKGYMCTTCVTYQTCHLLTLRLESLIENNGSKNFKWHWCAIHVHWWHSAPLSLSLAIADLNINLLL